METTANIRRVADQARAENESGVIAGDAAAQAYLDGVEDALRWATGDGVTKELAQLIARADAVTS